MKKFAIALFVVSCFMVVPPQAEAGPLRISVVIATARAPSRAIKNRKPSRRFAGRLFCGSCR